jgi:hypothetical protein
MIFMVDNRTRFDVETVKLGSVRNHCVDYHVITHNTPILEPVPAFKFSI